MNIPKTDISIHNLDTTIQPPYMAWSVENEEILVEWCDYAQCYRWLNYRAEKYYSFFHGCFTITTIVLSTLSGAASFAQASYQVSYVPFIVGSTNIFVGMINTLQQYFKVSEFKESHRVCEIAWGKLSRNILIEIAKAPNERMNATNFFKIISNEYDRLVETNPIIPDFIIQEFKNTFVGDEDSNLNKKYGDIRKPDICDGMISANTSRHKWYTKPDIPTYKVYDNSYNEKCLFYNPLKDISFSETEYNV